MARHPHPAIVAATAIAYELPLDDGEEVMGERYDYQADALIVVTSHGRKVAIGSDGVVSVLCGPPLSPREGSCAN